MGRYIWWWPAGGVGWGRTVGRQLHKEDTEREGGGLGGGWAPQGTAVRSGALSASLTHPSLQLIGG